MARITLCGPLLMPCRHPGPFPESTVHSVLHQPGCFELPVAGGASSDGSLQTLERLAACAVLEPYPTRPPSVGLAGFRDYCFICQPTVLWRRSMGVLLVPFSTTLWAAFDFDYWLRALSAFPERIGHIPHLQASTRVHPATLSTTQLPQALLEAAQLQARHFGVAGSHMLTNYSRPSQTERCPRPPRSPCKGIFVG